MDRIAPGSRLETVADATDRQEVLGIARVTLELGPQLHHEIINGSEGTMVPGTPNQGLDLFAPEPA